MLTKMMTNDNEDVTVIMKMMMTMKMMRTNIMLVYIR